MKQATALKVGGETVASCLKSRFLAKGFRLNVPTTGPSARQLGILFCGFLRPLADHTVTTLRANGFVSDKLMAANWACIWNIKDLVGIHFKQTPGYCGIMDNSLRRVPKPKGDSKRRMSHPALRRQMRWNYLHCEGPS